MRLQTGVDGTVVHPRSAASAGRSSIWSTATRARLGGGNGLTIYDIDFEYLPDVEKAPRWGRASTRSITSP